MRYLLMGRTNKKCSFGEGTTKYHMYELYGWINHHTVDILIDYLY